MKIQPLTKVDVTRYPLIHPIYSWLCSHGYRPKRAGDRMYLVRPAPTWRLPRDAREVLVAAGIGGFFLVVVIWFFNVVPTTRDMFAERPPAESCSCAGKPGDCYTKTFTVDDNTQAYCAMWSDDQSCCVVMRQP